MKKVPDFCNFTCTAVIAEVEDIKIKCGITMALKDWEELLNILGGKEPAAHTCPIDSMKKIIENNSSTVLL
jgi:hypothetical protein